jgi:hypothetical protein
MAGALQIGPNGTMLACSPIGRAADHFTSLATISFPASRT